MLDVAAFDDDAAAVPVANAKFFIPGRIEHFGGDEVVEGADGTVAGYALFGVGVVLVVEDLKLKADGGARAFVQLGVDEVFDAGVSAFSGFELELQFEVAEVFRGDDVAAVGAFAAVAGQDAKFAVGDLPTGFGKAVEFRAAPAFGGFTIPEQAPAVAFLEVGQGIRDVIDLHGEDGALNPVRRRGVLLDPQVPPPHLRPRQPGRNAVHLQADHTGSVEIIHHIGYRDTVDESAQFVADSLDPGLVPTRLAVGGPCGRVVVQRVQPTAA